uniref:Uncharacterized protein n=1 Tax=Podarcis muralis TaxID=64176 RepID=A0A670IQ16_PODMU
VLTFILLKKTSEVYSVKPLCKFIQWMYPGREFQVKHFHKLLNKLLKSDFGCLLDKHKTFL